MKKQEKNRALELRKMGLSYREISKILGVSKGILNLWLKSIILNEKAKQRIQKNIRDNQLRLVNEYCKPTDELKKLRSEGTKKWLATLSDEGRKKRHEFFMNIVIPASQSSFTDNEIIAKNKLDKIFGTDFKKEKINNIVIDFADKKFTIEYTHDNGKGTRKALDRLIQVKDRRTKILISPSYGFGKTRRKLLGDGYHWPITLFDSGIIPEAIKNLMKTECGQTW